MPKRSASFPLNLVLSALLLFGIPLGWVMHAHFQGQRPFATPAPAWAHTPSR